MLDAKIYGLCLDRLKRQLSRARSLNQPRVQLESYCVTEIGDIVDVLELFDLEQQSQEALREKLDELALTISVLMDETLEFDRDESGELGLYVVFESQGCLENKGEVALATV